MPRELVRLLDNAMRHQGGWLLVFGDTVRFAGERGLLSDEDKIIVASLLDRGVMRKAEPYFRKLIALQR